MRANYRYEVPMPEIPPGGLRRCSGCKKYKRCDDTNNSEFSTQINKRADGTKVRYWRGRCKRCEAAREQARKRPNNRVRPRERAENIARRRAMTRLTWAAPKVYLPLLIEELEIEYLKAGYPKENIPKMISERVQHVHRYIRELGDHKKK